MALRSWLSWAFWAARRPTSQNWLSRRSTNLRAVRHARETVPIEEGVTGVFAGEREADREAKMEGRRRALVMS